MAAASQIPKKKEQIGKTLIYRAKASDVAEIGVQPILLIRNGSIQTILFLI
jgi:hypothetical protein